MRRRFLAALPALLGLGALAKMSSSEATSVSPPWTGVLGRELEAIVGDKARPLASLSVLAIRAGEVAYHRQFGSRSLAGNGREARPADADTLYRIASLSKLLTTVAALRLVEAGKLDLDTDAGDILGFPLRNPHFPREIVTLRHLLTHTSSLRDDGGYYWTQEHAIADALVSGRTLYGRGEAWAANAGPGRFFQYANLPWGVVGTMLEKATGERFDRLVKRLVLDPLGIAGGFNPAEFGARELANVATLYRKRRVEGTREVWDPAGPWVAQVDDYSREAPVPRASAAYEIGTNGTLFGPQGAARLSAQGLGRFMRMLMNGGALEGTRVLQAATVDLMLSRQWTWDERAANGSNAFGTHGAYFNAWGLGNQHFLDVGGPGRGDRLVDGGGFAGVGHIGDAWGLTAAFAFDPRTKHGLVFLTGGPGFDPATDPGRYSARYGHEERILTALWKRAILGNAD